MDLLPDCASEILLCLRGSGTIASPQVLVYEGAAMLGNVQMRGGGTG
jgi:hypothetical protein